MGLCDGGAKWCRGGTGATWLLELKYWSILFQFKESEMCTNKFA